MTDTTPGETTRLAPRRTQFSDPTVGELFANQRRRYLLRGLRHADRDVTLAELARKIAAWEIDRSVADVSNAAVERVHLSLYHNHVPRLADAGLVEYDREASAVSLAGDAADAADTEPPSNSDREYEANRPPSHST